MTPATSRPARPHSPRPLDPSPLGRPLFDLSSFQGRSLDPIVDQVAPGTSLGSSQVVSNQVAPGLLDPPNPPVDPSLAGQNPSELASGPAPAPLPYDFLHLEASQLAANTCLPAQPRLSKKSTPSSRAGGLRPRRPGQWFQRIPCRQSASTPGCKGPQMSILQSLGENRRQPVRPASRRSAHASLWRQG
jgi:hypothetical protein